ncbi:MAG: T9SS type A sorting domain-containing protein [Flavobacteriales bacterium]|jgi:hypothetical protein|nr:T9SS type A sorting domain-containing protein [Flavobacteriales bacterium]
MKVLTLIIAIFIGCMNIHAQCSFTATGVALDCSGNSGEIEITPTGGTAPYTYSIDNGVTFQTDSIFSGLTGGTYTVILVDDNNCTSQMDIDVPGSLSVYVLNTVEDCTNQSGNFEIIASGGTGTYSYSIDNGNNFSNITTYPNLVGGTYNIVVEDADGCTATATENVAYPLEITDVTVTPSCSGQNTGQIVITAANGIGNYSYSFNGGGNFNNINQAENLSPGDFDLVLQDNFGCVVDTTVTINENPAIVPTTVETPVSCDGVTLGSIVVTLATPGTYDFSIDGGTSFQSGPDYTNTSLTSGNYILQIQDSYGCQETVNFFIDEQEIEDSIIKQNEFCGTANGEINVVAYIGEAPFEYSIDNGINFGANNVFSGLPAGTYYVHARDAVGCVKKDTVQIGNFGGIEGVGSEEDTICVGSNSSVSVNHNGGTGVTYEWDNGLSSQQTNVVAPVVTTDYSVIITDIYGCKDTAYTRIVVDEVPNLTVSQNQLLACIGDELQITASGADRYEWSTGDTTASVTIEVEGVTTYSVIGKIGNCLDEETINVIIKPMPTVVIDANKTSINTHDSIFFYSSGSVGSNYNWDFKDGYHSTLSNPYHKFDFPGAYQVELTVEMGSCEATDSILVYVGTVAIDEIDQQNIVVYPNPAKDFVNIKIESQGILFLTAMNGKLIQKTNLIKGINKIQTSSFPKGVYFLTIQSKNWQKKIKLIKT